MILHPTRRVALLVCFCCITIFLFVTPAFLHNGSLDIHIWKVGFEALCQGDSLNTSSVEGSESPHSRLLVTASTVNEDTSWVEKELGNEHGLSTRIYVTDNASSDYSVPLNKGHEAMVYLTYIIDEYRDLSDITLFVHAHQFAWHNNDLLNRDMAEMVRRLSPDYVVRNGYINLRCHHDPGCPSHIFPHEPSFDPAYPEAAVIGLAWSELFPGELIPASIAQPCCAQMAMSRENILAVPLQRYVDLRDWLLNTALDDRLSGRVFEYTWQYLWGQKYQYCPLQSVCYCDGYGVCFGGDEQYTTYDTIRRIAEEMDAEAKTSAADELHAGVAFLPKDKLLKFKNRMETQLELWRSHAFFRGEDHRNRAFEAGRLWTAKDDP
ncbi:hypothetical protein D6C78_07926 [Aureobasidium pullulans]|uniref:Uncharacterized protein n=1 Tax=Aureobasidium pullulans TaxID=5580 RepID=A0A4T0BLG1_AURPU|nr:hypothetical protein D6C78_07926 [Aureobasidium pullulans]